MIPINIYTIYTISTRYILSNSIIGRHEVITGGKPDGGKVGGHGRKRTLRRGASGQRRADAGTLRTSCAPSKVEGVEHLYSSKRYTILPCSCSKGTLSTVLRYYLSRSKVYCVVLLLCCWLLATTTSDVQFEVQSTFSTIESRIIFVRYEPTQPPRDLSL